MHSEKSIEIKEIEFEHFAVLCLMAREMQSPTSQLISFPKIIKQIFSLSPFARGLNR